MIKRTVHHLRQRPHHERRAVAAGIAYAVVAVLFLGWAAFFLQSLGSGQVQTQAPAAASDASVEISQQPNITPPSPSNVTNQSY